MVLETDLAANMTSDVAISPAISHSSQVRLKKEGKNLMLLLPDETDSKGELSWSETWQELKHRLKSREQFWHNGGSVSLVAKDRLLDSRQLHTIAETLKEVELILATVCTNRRQTAVAAATAGYSVEQNKPGEASLNSEAKNPNTSELMAEPLYLRNTIRSGVEVRHPGTIIICGDLNPGGSAIADGDLFVWGRLRGVAHAGSAGNRKSRIMALQMEFTQLRIADQVARAPKVRPESFQPETAFISNKGISLARSDSFGKTYAFSVDGNYWQETNSIKNPKY
ncbi:septum formation inhibitor [Xenococcus sp. PCC 7305]|uniref:septum site-determining protein MinC n=1 Tax=Xenococcus sp. PCC 7305 TaxID=102125 RepID=UPI0002AD1B6D|nr:septum site-determining protein MinC [Xenococcus sp. PCC 7305]ELS02813.1 septum formation inhibitor [Xenococcus sp. PCC 7305]